MGIHLKVFCAYKAQCMRLLLPLTQVTSSDSPGPFRTPLPHLESLCPKGLKPAGAPTQMSSDLPWLLEKVDSIGKVPSCRPPAPCQPLKIAVGLKCMKVYKAPSLVPGI